MAAGLVLGFLLASLVLGLLGPIGPVELIVFPLVFSIPLTFALRPVVRRFLTPRQRSQSG